MNSSALYRFMAIATLIGFGQSLLADPNGQAPDLDAIKPVAGFATCTHMMWRDRGWEVEKLIPILKQMGVSTIRDGLSWGRTEPVKGQYAIAPEDAAWINAVLAADIKIIFMLGYGNSQYENPLDHEGYAAFCAWLAEHFKGNQNILAFEIWNEPSNFHFKKQYGGEWNGKDDSPWLGKFAELVAKSSAAIKQADPNRVVITGGGNPPASMHMLNRYPEAFTYVDGLTLHPYSFRLPPEVVPYGGEGIARRDGVRTGDDDHSMVSLWRTLEDKMQEKLGRKLGIWVTEVGYTTFNHTVKPGLYAGYTESAQAAYLTRSTIAGLAWPNMKVWALYDLMNDGTNPSINEDNFGMVRHKRQGLAPKQSFFALRRMAELLGSKYQFIQQAPVELTSNALALDETDVWKKNPIDPVITDHSAKVYWFKTDTGYVTFVWRAGRINGEHNPPVGNLATVIVPSDTSVTITDLVSGQSLDHLVNRDGNDVTLRNLPIQGHPLAIAWTTTGQIQPLTEPQAGDTIDLPISDARGKWKFTNGPEFKGATGSITVPKADDQPLAIKYDFTAGGNYVAAIKYLNPKIDLASISLKVSGDTQNLTLRVIDKTDQVFQYKLGQPDKDGKLQLDLLNAKASTSWGGAKDRKIHPPLSSIWVLVGKQADKPVGQVDVRSMQITIGQTPAE